jgi:hypothetical protein
LSLGGREDGAACQQNRTYGRADFHWFRPSQES